MASSAPSQPPAAKRARTESTAPPATSSSGSGNLNSAILQINNLSYRSASDLSTAISRTYLRSFFSQTSYNASSSTRMIAISNSGSSFVNLSNSFLQFKVTNIDPAASVRWGKGSVLNIFNSCSISGRDGTLIESTERCNVTALIHDNTARPPGWMETVGSAAGYLVPREPGDLYDTNHVPHNSGSRSYSVPLSSLFSLARGSQLAPSFLMAGARFSFLLENPLVAGVWDANPTLPGYQISDLSLNLDCTQLSDSCTRSISLAAASAGLSMSFNSVHTQESVLQSNFSDEIRKSVSRGLTVYSMIRPVDNGPNMWSTDFFATPNNSITRYGVQLGSSHFPLQPYSGAPGEIEAQLYTHTLKHLGRLGNSSKPCSTLSLSKFSGRGVGGGLQVLCTSLERANLDSSSGLSSNNSRSLIVSMGSNLSLGSHVVVHCLVYESVLQIYINNLSVAS
jgi:hypothetical protein